MSRLYILILVLLTATTHAQKYDTIRVLFPVNKTQLTDTATRMLDSLVSHQVLKPNARIVLLGYGDYLGSAGYNKNLSWSRAKNVQDYLLLAGFSKDGITLVIGKGKVNRAPANGKDGNAADRKVDIIIDHPIDTPAAQKFVYYMQRLQVNESMPLRNVEFFRGSIRIIPASMPIVRMLIDFMLANPTFRIQLEGHVCCLPPGVHDEPYDESTLSTLRAAVIRDSMVVHGVPAERILAVGLGTSDPIAYPETSEEDQQLNRRVEVRIISK